LQISKAQLNRKLNSQTGYSPGKLILHHRMELAKQLLHTGLHTVKEIAHQCGFSSLDGFSRTFRQEFGSSPTAYRDSIISQLPALLSWEIPLNEYCFTQLIQLRNKNIWLANLLEIVVNNLDNELFTVEELSSLLFMSSSNLNRKVQRLFGFSTVKLVRDIRLQHVAELLTVQKKTVNEAAMLAGFFDAAHLSRYFKQAFGCSPGDYRNVNEFFPCIDKLNQ
jgi:AraC-like DNA-binding protein